MKTIIFAILTLNFTFSTLNCFAQPNPGFENWTTTFGIEDPDNWQTANFLSLLSPPNPLSAFKAIGVDVHTGNYALKLKTVFINNNPAPSQIHDSLGIIFTGKVNSSPFLYILGYPYTGRPEKMEFWATYTPAGIDTGAASVFLIKHTGISRDTIAGGAILISQRSTYSLFQLTLTYQSTALPDSAIIAFSSSSNIFRTHVGSTLFVDDVAFTGWVGIDQYDINSNKVKVFPNPAKDNITIRAQIEEADNVQVIDISSKVMGVYKIQNYIANINTNAFTEGIYFYNIRDKTNCILTKGKFNVIK